jgi:hypothetical protein
LAALLDHFLIDYLEGGVREMFLIIGDRVKNNSDLVVNGMQEKSKNIEEVLYKIEGYYNFGRIFRK